MITLEQVKLLEQKIEAAVLKISALGKDNASLQVMCDEFDRENTRLQDENVRLEGESHRISAELASLKASQAQYQAEREQLEQVVLHAIERLEAVETTVLETVVSQAEWKGAPVPSPSPEAVPFQEPTVPLSPPEPVPPPQNEAIPDEQYIPFGTPQRETVSTEDFSTSTVEIATFTPGDSGAANGTEPQDTLDLF